jgi:hypothetical protein
MEILGALLVGLGVGYAVLLAPLIIGFIVALAVYDIVDFFLSRKK